VGDRAAGGERFVVGVSVDEKQAGRFRFGHRSQRYRWSDTPTLLGWAQKSG
jgi:hypothetical protein